MGKVELSKKYWQSVTLGSQVILTDQAAIEASMNDKRGMEGMQYTIDNITSITEFNNLCSWIVYRIVNPKQILFLVVKIIGEEAELRVFYNPESIPSGNRADMINAEMFFMFANANDSSLNNLLKLKYVQEINWTFDFGSGPYQVLFTQKGGLELTGKASLNPPAFQGETIIATISEYSTKEVCAESEMMILEVGNVKSKQGGLINFLVGNKINEFELEVVCK